MELIFKNLDVILWILTGIECLVVTERSIRGFRHAYKKYKETSSLQVLNGVPGMCVSWGVFFTFFSIVLSLALLLLKGEAEDFSIFSLAGSLMPAFLTSVFGNGFSIYYAGKIRNIIADDEKKECREKGDPMQHFQKMAADIDAMRKLQEGQNTVFQTFMNTFTQQLSDFLNRTQTGFEKHVNEHLDKELKNLTAALTQSIATTEATLAATSKEHAKSMNESLQDTSRKIARLYEGMKDSVRKSSEQAGVSMRVINQTMEKDSKDMLNEMKAGMEQFNETLANHMGQMSTALQTAANNAHADVESINQGIRTSVHSMLEQLDEQIQFPLEKFKAEVEFVSDRVGQITEQYKQSANAYSDALKDAHNQNEVWEKAAEKMEKCLGFIETTQEHVESVLEAIATREEGLTKVTLQIAQIQESVAQLQQLNATLSKIANKNALMNETA